MENAAIYPRLLGSVESLRIALEVRDEYTRFHCDRVVRLATELGNACGVLDRELDYLRIGARFHDVGKIGVPDAVLLKPGPLTTEEWVVMKSHPVLGERIFKATDLPDQDAIASLIRHHHEAFDGTGYPDCLQGDSIPLLSRILLIVDAYDAMGTSRPYHKARSHAVIMEILESETGKKLDPTVFHEFKKQIGHSPARVH